MSPLGQTSRQISRTGFGEFLAYEQTLKAAIGCVGTGVHTGKRVSVRLEPAEPGHGIAFHRRDLGITIPARFDSVVDTKLCTVVGIEGNPEARVGTIEHLMAALAAAGIDNCLVVTDGPELPIFDGSAANWSFLIACAGIATQDAPRRAIEILRPVTVSEGEASASLLPSQTGEQLLDLAMAIDFPAAAIGAQQRSLRLTAANFAAEAASARTFAQAAEIEALREAGLALGGSLDNAIVVDGAAILNPGGLRFADEFVRHKLLDAVGDLALAGSPLFGRFAGNCSGHRLNNLLLRALFASQANWRFAAVEAWKPEVREAA
jgi:UDP-3-O-[3-hydroxymyristoyl] N-acetylglucosamine deacetylase